MTTRSFHHIFITFEARYFLVYEICGLTFNVSQLSGLTRNSKIFLLLVMIQFVVVVGITVATMVMNRTSDVIVVLFLKDVAYGLLIIVSILFFVYFALDAVR